MTKAPERLDCKRLVQAPDKSCYCGFTGKDWREFPAGCGACIDVPLVKDLLGRHMEQQENYLQEIRQTMKSGQTALVLGAGISIPMKMPTWQGLVSQMAGHAMKYYDYKNQRDKPDADETDHRRLSRLEQELISKELTLFSGINVLESGQYIAQTLGKPGQRRSGEELIKEIVSVIVEDSTKPQDFLKNWEAEHPDQASGALNREEKLLALARSESLCAAAYLLRAKNGFRCALTYNFDTLVEEYLIKLIDVPPGRIISHPGEWSGKCAKKSKDPIHIFHVHGCIPRRESRQDPDLTFLRESRSIILSEDSYYDTERYEAYNWQNSIQSYYLNRNSCVFVGFSADDYNFRRILRQMDTPGARRTNGPRHYLILTINELVKDIWMSICRSHLSKGTTAENIRRDTLMLLRKLLYMKENYWARYGFYPIWVSVDDIPETLLSLI